MTRTNQMVASSVALEPLDLNGFPYTPALLLDGRFGAWITDDPDFRCGCEYGFEAYYETLEEEPPPLGLFSLKAVLSDVFDWIVKDTKADPRLPAWCVVSIPWAVGFTLGWLSALARRQYQEAQDGLCELQRLYQKETKQGGFHG